MEARVLISIKIFRCVREADMPQDAERYLEAAHECVRAADRFKNDADAAAVLLKIAQHLIELAKANG
jgi:hypothetical protein